MRVLLIEPGKARATIGGDDVFVYEPLALEYVAAGVAQDHDVRILDLRLENDLGDVLERFRPDVVGITGYTVHVNPVRRLFDAVKRWHPGALTVVGGDHATFPVLAPLPGADFYERVRGEMIAHNYDYFDFIHTLLPTRLPLKAFYEEYQRLYASAIPWVKGIALLSKYRLRDIPPFMRAYGRFLHQLRTAYWDYALDGAPQGEGGPKRDALRPRRMGDRCSRAAHSDEAGTPFGRTQTSPNGYGEGRP